MTREDDRDQPDPPAGPSRRDCRRAVAVVRAPGCGGGRPPRDGAGARIDRRDSSDVPASSASSSASSPASSRRRAAERRRSARRGRVGSSSGSGPRSPEERGRSGPGSSPRAAASRRRSSSRKSSNRSLICSGVYAQRRFRAGGDPRRHGRTRKGRSRQARSVAWRQPGRARNGTRHGRRAGERHGRVGSSGGAICPSRSWSRPSSSRIRPDNPPLTPDPAGQAADRVVDRRRGDVTKADDSVPSLTHRTRATSRRARPTASSCLPETCGSRCGPARSRRNEGPGAGSRSGTGGG